MATQLSPTSATILERSLGMPPEGPKCIPFTLDFATTDTFNLDYSNMGQRGFMSMVQTIWCDNSLSGTPVNLICPATNQTIKVPAGVQDYFAIMCPNPIKLQFISAGGVVVQILLINFPVAPQKNI